MIRAANLSDIDAIAKLTIQAMGDLATQFRASENVAEATQLIKHFIAKTNNQYSYTNSLVYVQDHVVVGSINAYDGDLLMKLRKPFFDYLEKHYYPNGFHMEPESDGGEFYIDTLSVHPTHQGKGIGKELIQAAIEWAKQLGHSKIGLLVNIQNPNAKRLYQSLGFEKKDQKILLGSTNDHMVLSL